jgi:hypothetical protein
MTALRSEYKRWLKERVILAALVDRLGLKAVLFALAAVARGNPQPLTQGSAEGMASDHANRANRPNTWLLRPMLQA